MGAIFISKNHDTCIDQYRYFKTPAGFFVLAACRRCAKNRRKKRATRMNQGPYRCEGKNLQRGTAAAVELGGKPPCASAGSYLVPICAVRNEPLCMSAMHLHRH